MIWRGVTWSIKEIESSKVLFDAFKRVLPVLVIGVTLWLSLSFPRSVKVLNFVEGVEVGGYMLRALLLRIQGSFGVVC